MPKIGTSLERPEELTEAEQTEALIRTISAGNLATRRQKEIALELLGEAGTLIGALLAASHRIEGLEADKSRWPDFDLH